MQFFCAPPSPNECKSGISLVMAWSGLVMATPLQYSNLGQRAMSRMGSVNIFFKKIRLVNQAITIRNTTTTVYINNVKHASVWLQEAHRGPRPTFSCCLPIGGRKSGQDFLPAQLAGPELSSHPRVQATLQEDQYGEYRLLYRRINMVSTGCSTGGSIWWVHAALQEDQYSEYRLLYRRINMVSTGCSTGSSV